MTPPTYKVPGVGQFAVPVTVIDEAGHSDSYRMRAVCLNCKWEGQVRIATGRRTTRSPGYDCPACVCRTVEATTLVGRDGPDNDSRALMQKWHEANESEMRRRLYAMGSDVGSNGS